MSAEADSPTFIRLLQAAGIAHAAREPLDLQELARDLNTPVPEVESQIDQLDRLGLLLPGMDDGLPPMMPQAGRQYLALRGDVPRHVLQFLPHIIDDVHAREALLFAGTVLVDEFRHQLMTGRAVAHATELVPPAFAAAVDEALALNLFAAAVALMVRLSDGSPAGCVAEEILAVRLIELARQRLESRPHRALRAVPRGRRARPVRHARARRCRDRRPRPAQAADRRRRPTPRQLVQPVAWTTPTGYLGRDDQEASADA